jgi:hypothetical protein
VLGVVHAATGRLVLADRRDANAGRALRAHQLGLEHDLARLVGAAVGPATVSALARLLATTFRRWLCAETALPATLKIWNIDMV